jgi:arylsulfatase A-like enzyme
VLLSGGCARTTPPAPTARHLVLVTIDTLRADRLGCYGGTAATPRLDRIAREGALAPDASVHVPLTRPSHASLLSGLLPARHGIRDNISPALDATVPLLA